MYACHHCHGYADQLDGSTSCNWFIFDFKKHDTGGYDIGHKPIGLERIYGELQVI